MLVIVYLYFLFRFLNWVRLFTFFLNRCLTWLFDSSINKFVGKIASVTEFTVSSKPTQANFLLFCSSLIVKIQSWCIILIFVDEVAFVTKLATSGIFEFPAYFALACGESSWLFRKSFLWCKFSWMGKIASITKFASSFLEIVANFFVCICSIYHNDLWLFNLLLLWMYEVAFVSKFATSGLLVFPTNLVWLVVSSALHFFRFCQVIIIIFHRKAALF